MAIEDSANNGNSFGPDEIGIQGLILVDEVELIFQQNDVKEYIKRTYGRPARDPNVTPLNRIVSLVSFAGIMAIGSVVSLDMIGNQLLYSLRHIPY